MPQVILRDKGKAIEVKEFHKDKYPYLNIFIRFLEGGINELKKSKNIDIKVN